MPSSSDLGATKTASTKTKSNSTTIRVKSLLLQAVWNSSRGDGPPVWVLKCRGRAGQYQPTRVGSSGRMARHACEPEPPRRRGVGVKASPPTVVGVNQCVRPSSTIAVQSRQSSLPTPAMNCPDSPRMNSPGLTTFQISSSYVGHKGDRHWARLPAKRFRRGGSRCIDRPVHEILRVGSILNSARFLWHHTPPPPPVTTCWWITFRDEILSSSHIRRKYGLIIKASVKL